MRFIAGPAPPDRHARFLGASPGGIDASVRNCHRKNIVCLATSEVRGNKPAGLVRPARELSLERDLAERETVEGPPAELVASRSLARVPVQPAQVPE